MKLNLSKEWYREAGASEECPSVTAGVPNLDAFIQNKLLQLSGLTVATNNRFREEAIRFAARSEPVDSLSQKEPPEEHEVLREFVKHLSED